MRRREQGLTTTAQRRIAVWTVFILAFVAALGLATTRSSADQIDGQQVFRYDTFGDEQLWTNVLRMHEVVATVDPATALGVGLKVDADALPPSVTAANPCRSD
jgi:hypothetical protein